VKKDARRHSFRRLDGLGEPMPAESFKAEVRAWAERLDVEPEEIHVMAMKRKWASCSTRGRVTFDRELLALPEPFRREVIVHELLHLKVPNHGPLFRALLRTHVGGGHGSTNPPAS
jgi:predicted metal-dependent hydrolase